MIAPKRKHTSTFLRVFVDLSAELLRHGADGKWVLHVSVVGVGGGDDGSVGVDGVVVEKVVAEVLFELGEEAGGDESCGSGIDAGLALLYGVSEESSGKKSRGLFTWPPENPTATTPSSLPLDRNFG